MTKPDQCGMVTQMIRMMRITKIVQRWTHQRPQCGMVTPIMRTLITIEVDNDDKDVSYDSIIKVAGREDMDYMKLHEMK